METYKKTDRLIKKLMSFFAAALIVMGTLVPDAVVAQAAVTLNVAQYVSAGGTVSGEVGSNSGKYSGKWEAHIPMGKVMSAIESEMKLAADKGLYPHGKDGTNTIAYIEYTVTFPAGVNIDSANIQKSNTTAMFNGGAFSHSVNGQSVYFRFPLKDENWKAIYNYYKNDGGAASDKTIDITIPYSASASGSDEAKAFEAKTISAAGSFETHASGTLYSFTKTVYYTDNSSQPAAKDFSSSDVFAAPAPPPTPTPTPEPTPTAEPAPTPTAEPAPNPDPSAAEYKQTLELDADLRLGDDTGNKAITKKQWDDMDFTGVLDAKAIKGQLAAIEASYPGAEAGKITLKNLTTGFTATLTLPDGLSFVKSEAILAGANGKFEIESVALENQTATVKFKLVDADKISDFAQLKAAVNAVEDELKVIFKTAKFAASATAGTDYEVTGAVTGKLTAEASYTASHKTVNFDLTWNGRQSESGKSETNPNAIAISVNYPQTISLDSNLDGDLLVNGNTQHEEVYTAKKNDSLTITGLLDVAPIKKQMKKIEDEHTVNPEDIAISNLSTKFTSDITLPEEMKFADGYTVELTGANGKFEITDKQLEGKKLTLTMTLAGDIKTFKDIKEAVEGVDDQLKVNVKGVMFDADKAKANTNYTMKGTLSGMFQARATNTKSGKVIDFNLSWYGKQLEGGEDSTDPATKDIKLTVKYAAPSENTFEAAQKLPGDILVGKNTEHDKVYVVSQGAKVVFTGSLDVSSVKAQMKAIEEQFGKTNVDPSGIEISDYSSAFVATLTLPEEMDFSSKPSVSLKDDNGKYKIVSVKLEGKKITVEMTVNKEVKTFADIRDAVNGMGDKLNVLIDGAKFNGKALPNKNYTVKGTMSGNLKAKATEPLSGNVINFNLSWEAEQLPEGADAINPSSKDITFTLKYTPKTVVTPKTGDSLNLFLYPAVMIISIIGLCLVYKQNKKKYTGK